MRRRRIGLLIGIWVLAAGAVVQASTIASWDNRSQPGSQAVTPGEGSAHVRAASMVRGSGLGAPSGTGSLSSSGWNGMDLNDYIELGFSVDSGYTVALGDLWIGTRSSATGPGFMGVYTSLDGYLEPVSTISQAQGNNDVGSIIDLSGLGSVSGVFVIRLMEVGDTQADGVGATAAVGTFRVKGYTADGGATFADTRITGDASAVPIPGAVWLLGAGLVGVARFRRKTRR